MQSHPGEDRPSLLEAAAKAANLVLLELDFARGSREGLMILGESMGASRLALYSADEALASFHPLTTWPEGGAGAWSGIEGSAAVELALSLAESASVDGSSGPAALIFPSAATAQGEEEWRQLIPLPASGKAVGFLAASFALRPSGLVEGILASFALSLSASRTKAEAEKALARAFAEEAAARRASTLLFARASHELRTPLVALDGITALLEEKADTMDPLRRKEAIGFVRQGGKRLMRLVENLLALTRIDAGLRRPEARPVDFAQLARSSESLMAGLLASKGVSFSVRLASGLPEPFASDSGAIEEVLENLLGNAAKFTASGSIELAVEPAGGGLVSFTVRDEGIGMDAVALASFREPFHGSGTGLGGERGSGLGLSIVAGLARLLGGEVFLDSEQGKGSTARLVIPPLPPAGTI